ncbi:tyrosine-type recombinase/integrase [Corynebacterium gerontici]|uniref:Tyrosine recombinase XerC n=1 Tax=Corynebacterium gerontici TaxID=2079234 RepID=A0A3G6J5Q0_9CORY|nr:site-specific integrase [Corynebacterium gerontici]AZA12258.1 Tyrosine recombinase XerC [Corynebacterium gerontici]
MAVQRRFTARGDTRWIGRFRDAKGKEHAKSFRDENAAKHWVHTQQELVKSGNWVNVRDASRVGDLARLWAGTSERSNTHNARQHFLKNLNWLAAVDVEKLTPTDIRDWHAQLLFGRPWAGGRTLAPRTVSHLMNYLSRTLDHAVELGTLGRNPMQSMRFSDPGTHQVKSIPSIEELQLLVDATRPEHHWLALAIHVATTCGLRASEAAGLQRGDYGSEGLRIERQCTKTVGEYSPLKTPASYRSVPVPEVLSDVIRRQPNGETPLLRTRSGTGVSGAVIANAMAATRKRAGLSETLTFHALRHFYASHMLGSGVPLPAVSRLLGHANSAVTARIYAHYIDGQETEALSASKDLELKLGFEKR